MISRFSLAAVALTLIYTPRLALAQPVLEEPMPPPAHPAVVPKVRPKSLTVEQMQTITGGPTLVSFSQKAATFDQICRVLFPSSAPLPTSELAVKTIDVDWKDVPYYVALSQVDALTQSTWIKRFHEIGLLREWYNEELSQDGRALVSNPFVQVKLMRLVHSSEHMGLFKSSQKSVKTYDSSNLQISVAVDPKLFVPIAFVRLSDVRLANGQTPSWRRDAFDIDTDPNESLYSNLATLYPELPLGLTSDSRITQVKGYFRMYAAPEVQTLKIPDLLQAPPQNYTIGKQQYTVESAKWDGQDLNLLISVTGVEDLDGRDKVIDTMITTTGLNIRDGQGNLLRSTDSSANHVTLPGGESKLVIEWKCRTQFGTPGRKIEGPFSLHWSIPIDPVMFEAPFEIHDLVIP